MTTVVGRLDAEWLHGWCEQAAASLAKFMQSFQARHGFEPGTNVVVLASEASHQATETLVELTPIPSDLTTMYWVIDEVSLPDVENGYFVHPASLVAEHFREYGAVQIDGEEPAMVFASDGGGHLFALAGSGRVWRSTTASWFDQFDLAAAGLQEFLEGLSRQISGQL
ncbi:MULTISPECIES: hypothetical protein [Streptomyces]|uniref:SMI1/KNR4 family protein n=2 Tax=Streptomyces TaxID=1883 RepID=A0ABY9J2R5_9ACTN|nr:MULTISPECIES: hypothetical protein [unclassified Streptomyces]TXS08070.1 hypothetical protein EAO68_37775 [Streptomyces sp. wa22]WLQ62118.1 hypothetical protein P8A20_00280 [Streptomyces sp. Alt3]